MEENLVGAGTAYTAPGSLGMQEYGSTPRFRRLYKYRKLYGKIMLSLLTVLVPLISDLCLLMYPCFKP